MLALAFIKPLVDVDSEFGAKLRLEPLFFHQLQHFASLPSVLTGNNVAADSQRLELAKGHVAQVSERRRHDDQTALVLAASTQVSLFKFFHVDGAVFCSGEYRACFAG